MEKYDNVVDEIPDKLPVLPLRDIVIFPYMIFPVLVGREQSINAANFSVENGKFIFLATQKNSGVDAPDKKEIHREGTIAKIVQILKLPNGLMKILVDGVMQGKIKKYTRRQEFFEAYIEPFIPDLKLDHEMNALSRQVTQLFKEYVKINRNIPSEVLSAFENIEEPDRKLFYAAANVNQTIEVKQELLRKKTVKEQYYTLIGMLNSEIDILRIEKEIDSKVQENIARTQRKFIIQEQIKILQDELGDEDDSTQEFEQLRKKIKKAKMPKDVFEKAEEELTKLTKTPPMSPEYTVIRNYLDWLIGVPWTKKSKDNLDISHVKKILDEDHFGLEKPKDRIIEHIAVLNLVKQMKGQILCFVGPPGVGKTSLGKSIARALNRNFARLSLGGVRDEAEIRGHRRTYIGALPGKIIQAMKRAGTLNPVILLDEIDKLSSDFRGDPSSAMLEVLDPEQNHSFNDHYLEVDYDLSQVLFITTANVRYNIPHPLQDRMEIIELNGYLEHDKIEIAKRHIIPKQIESHGLADSGIHFSDEAIRTIISDYTREAGVRNLERELASICRKIAKDIVLTDSPSAKRKSGNKSGISVGKVQVDKYLGVPRFKQQRMNRQQTPGSITGLAWTSVGGEILHVDAAVMDGKEKLQLTGQVGDVMQESAKASLSYLRANAALFGLRPDFFKAKEIHIHLPEGSIPKDGPSAGITLIMSMISVFSGIPAAPDLAMTGEITLRGEVLAIGGLTEKLLAAKRYNMKTVIIPQDNEVDLKEVQDKVKSGLNIIGVQSVVEAIPYVFPDLKIKNAPAAKSAGRRTKRTKK
jgi:ATP-dependent Lon protease